MLGEKIADEVGKASGGGLKLRHHRVYVKGGQLVNGVPLPIYTEGEKERIRRHGKEHHHRHKSNNGTYGGSFAPL
jgi:hypothetical protein